jgi:hypothetical protein
MSSEVVSWCCSGDVPDADAYTDVRQKDETVSEWFQGTRDGGILKARFDKILDPSEIHGGPGNSTLKLRAMIRVKTRVFGFIVALGLSGCGSSANLEVLIPNNPPQPAPQLSGTVLSESGGPVTGVRIVAQERTTRQESEFFSAGDGTFAVSLPAGTYDLGLDLEGDPTTATTFYGPVTLAANLEADLVLRSAQGHLDSEVFGRILLRSGVPAAGRSVSVVTGATIGDVPGENLDPVTTTTASDGTFALNLPNEREASVDVEVYDANDDLDEFIDIGKRDKACYVEFITEESNVENTLRSNQSELAPNAFPSFLAQSGGVTLFDIAFGATGDFTLTNGLMPVQSSGTIPQLAQNFPAPADRTPFQANLVNWSVRIDTNGSWWWKYGANVFVNLPATWHFTDETNDTYKLSALVTDVVNGEAFKVSYNSSKPNIKVIKAE